MIRIIDPIRSRFVPPKRHRLKAIPAAIPAPPLLKFIVVIIIRLRAVLLVAPLLYLQKYVFHSGEKNSISH